MAKRTGLLIVTGKDGLRGVIDTREARDRAPLVTVQLDSGQQQLKPLDSGQQVVIKLASG